MWEVIIEISADTMVRTIYKYQNILSAEKIFNRILNDWKQKYRKYKVRIILMEEQKRVLKERELSPSVDE